jgi:CheY-like chemotaxis protein
LKNLTPAGGKVLKKSSGKGPYVLRTDSFEVAPAADGAEAFQRASEIHPDIIVTDLAMPNCDGWQFVQDVKQAVRTRSIPVVAVSGYAERSLRERAGGYGFAVFFPKPCLPDALAAGLRQVLDGTAHAHVER